MRRAVLLALIVLVAPAGCGGDEEEPAATATETTPTETAPTAPAETTSAPAETEPAETEEEETAPVSPEDLEGGAGDEEPARVLALFTGRGGRITPRVIRVPAFISVRVELRSADGQEYGLRFEGEGIRVSEGLGSVSTTIDGLRPGESVVGEADGGGRPVRIEATAEPGP